MITARLFLGSAFCLWLFGSIAGMATLWDHETRPGLAAEAPTEWPADSKLGLDESGSTMLVWIHPQCPCSWASVHELQRLLVRLPESVDVRVILSRPPECDEAFVETDLTRAVRQLDGVAVVVDHQQHEAARFGVETSGQVLLYGQNRDLLFAGGITPGRGHEGDSVGGATLQDIFQMDHSASLSAPDSGSSAFETKECSVFGCGLFSATRDQSQTP